MLNYETDEERAEAIKRWWKQNWLSIALGAGIGLGAIFGWRAWTQYQETVARQASGAFEQLLAVADTDDEAGLARSEQVREEFPATIYATLAALAEARIRARSGDLAAARDALEQAIAASPDPGITRIATLRLARILIAEGDLEGAADVVAGHDQGTAFSGAFAVLRGEIAEARGRTADARVAYEQALAAGAPNPNQVRVRLGNL